MLDLQIISDFVYENFPNVTTSTNGTHFHCKCILCGDSEKNKLKKRFHLDYNEGQPIWHCWNCGRSGAFLELYCELKGITIAEAQKELFKFNPKYLIQKLSNRKKEKIIKEISEENFNYIKKYCVTEKSKDSGILCKKYIEVLKKFRKDRQIDDYYKLMICTSGDYKGRIIIPIYDDYKNIVFFQARRMPGSEIIPKYKNPSIKKGKIIYNKQNFDKNKHIIISEGLIDAMVIGDQGTTCFGVEISDYFLNDIISYSNKYPIVIFDNDGPGYDALVKFIKGIGKNSQNKYCKRVMYFLFPDEVKDCKDINELSIKYNLRQEKLYDFIVKNSKNYLETYSQIFINNPEDK